MGNKYAKLFYLQICKRKLLDRNPNHPERQGFFRGLIWLFAPRRFTLTTTGTTLQSAPAEEGTEGRAVLEAHTQAPAQQHSMLLHPSLHNQPSFAPQPKYFPRTLPPFSNYSVFSNCPPRALHFQETHSGVKDSKEICQTSIPQPWPSSKATSCQGRPREKAALHHPLTLLTEIQEQIISHSSASRDNNLFFQHYAVIVHSDQALSLREKLFLRYL